MVSFRIKRIMSQNALDFATKVRLIRGLLKWRQGNLAQAIGVAPITVSRWESGTQVPHDVTKRMLKILAERNGVVFDELGYPLRETDFPAA